MRKIAICAFAMLFISAVLPADWDDAAGRGLIPFWVNAGGFYTMLVFVSGHEDTPDVIEIRFCDDNGRYCSDTTADMFSIRSREMLVFSTRQKTPHWIPTTADYGYVMFRTWDGGYIHAWALICNELSGAAMVVPAYDQDSGF